MRYFYLSTPKEAKRYLVNDTISLFGILTLLTISDFFQEKQSVLFSNPLLLLYGPFLFKPLYGFNWYQFA
jgi:hypothetical protein